MFYRSVELGGDIFFAADAEVVKQVFKKQASQLYISADSFENSVLPRRVVQANGGDEMRLRGYEELSDKFCCGQTAEGELLGIA